MPPDKKNNLLSLPAFVLTCLIPLTTSFFYISLVFLDNIIHTKGNTPLYFSLYTYSSLFPLVPFFSLLSSISFAMFSFNLRAGSKISLRIGIITLILVLILASFSLFVLGQLFVNVNKLTGEY